MSFGQRNSSLEIPLSLSPTRVILDHDTGAFFTWEQEQQIIAKLIYKNIYKDDLKAAIALYVEENNKHENTRRMLDLQRNQVARYEADLRMANNRLDYADRLKRIAEENWIKEEKRKRRWRRITFVAGGGGLILGYMLAK